MPDAVIENPIINSPYVEPKRQFLFTDSGISSQIVESRRRSSYFVPIPKAKKAGGKVANETEWTGDRVQENKDVDKIRERVAQWRSGGYASVTPITRRLLEHWTNPERDNKLFFCQIEALETAIYITEVASKFGDGWIADKLKTDNDSSNPGLPRVALKMATGTGKTVVMGMLIAWQALNKITYRQDNRFTDTFVLITPGITIKDRLNVLKPNVSDNYYRERDLIPNDLVEKLNQAKILITNFHAFIKRDTQKVTPLGKKMLAPRKENPVLETPGQTVLRVCKDLHNKKNIIVINDEAHHCYRRNPNAVEEKFQGEDREEAEKRNKQARLWISGIEAMQSKFGVKTIYDLSATPFFLRGSGYAEGTLFPWVVSDFSLIDAIESGIVKVPRVPVADNSMEGELPKYRDLWVNIRDSLPKKGRGTEAVSGEPKLPAALQGAIHALYGNYEKSYKIWAGSNAKERGQTPPVFIVVCNNTNVSKLVFDYVSGWEKEIPNPQKELAAEKIFKLVPGALKLFSNVNEDGKWLHRPNTILVDSQQLESGEGMSADFKKIAAAEIETFKQDYRARGSGRSAENITDEDILREVMNTVGKQGKLGESIRCVVSVSMLTEGWDANTVTHILGVRAFGTQLLCEQVVGRGLRRMSYVVNDEGMFEPEYAEVYGVPFSFIPCSGATAAPPMQKEITRVRALEERKALEITFPRLIGYKFELPAEKLNTKFTESSIVTLSPQDIPTRIENAPIIGAIDIHNLDDVKARREQEVVFLLASEVLKRYFKDEDECIRADLFPQMLGIVREWMSSYVVCKDDAFKQMLLFHEVAKEAVDKIYLAIDKTQNGETTLKPILQPYDSSGSTQYVDFNTSKPTFVTRADKCHISHVVGDSNWEFKMAEALESIPEVFSFVKNQNLNFSVPYTLNGEEHLYFPDFIAVLKSGDRTVKLVIEVSGETKKDKITKVETMRTLWIPAVNNHGGHGRWAFIEVKDPWEVVEMVRCLI